MALSVPLMYFSKIFLITLPYTIHWGFSGHETWLCRSNPTITSVILPAETFMALPGGLNLLPSPVAGVHTREMFSPPRQHEEHLESREILG